MSHLWRRSDFGIFEILSSKMSPFEGYTCKPVIGMMIVKMFDLVLVLSDVRD